jgi:hypothetical protein
MVVAQRAIDAFRHEGAIQVFHGPGLSPAAERARWRGQLVNFTLVLAPEAGAAGPSPARSDPSSRQPPQARREAIHLAPFVTFERLRDAQAEAVCLWRGMSDRGQVLLGEDIEDPRAWRPLGTGTLLWPFQRDEALAAGSSREPAFPAGLRHLEAGLSPLDPPTARGAPLARPREPFLPSSALGPSFPDVPSASPAGRSSGSGPGSSGRRSPLRGLAILLGVTLAIAATAWFALRIASDLEGAAGTLPASPTAGAPAEALATAPPTPPPARDASTSATLAPGVWSLTATPLGSGPSAASPSKRTAQDRVRSPPPAASYRLQLQRMSDAAGLEGTLTRLPSAVGSPRPGLRPPPGTTPASGPVTPVGPTPGGSWVLRAGLKAGGPNELVEIGMRVRPFRGGLLGIWRHEGAERDRRARGPGSTRTGGGLGGPRSDGGVAGVVTGALEGAAPPEPSECLVTCLAACADLGPAADPASEACLGGCLAPDRCP